MFRRSRRSHAIDKPKRRSACFMCLVFSAGIAVLPLILIILLGSCKREEQMQSTGSNTSSLCAWKQHLSLHTPHELAGMSEYVTKLLHHSPPATSSPPTSLPPPPSPPATTELGSSLHQQQGEQQQQQQQQQEQQQQHTAPGAHNLRPDHHYSTHGVEEVELPKSNEDIERIMKFPHVSSCQLCKVCIPHHVVAKHPLAQEKEKELAHVLGRGDLLEESATHAGSRQRKKSRRKMLHGVGRASSESYESNGLAHTGRRLVSGPDEETLDSIESDGIYHNHGRPIDISEIAPGDTRRQLRMHLPNCTVCWGCKHTLEPMASGDILFDSYYAHEPGGSPSWLFQVRTNKTASGWAVVKTWCVPVMKVKQRGLGMCDPSKVYTQVKLLLAQQQITAKCGLNTIVPKLWIEPLHGVLPGHGFRVDWLGLWFDTADGVSVQNIQEAGHPPAKPETILDLFQNNINHTEIKLVAIFDILFSQCDRHQQNLFMTEKGQVRIIDNDQVYATAWRKCGFDSLILPTTQKFMINHLGFFYVLKYPQKDPPTQWSKTVNPLLLLDYRCHVENGTIGKNFPPQVHQCMSDLAKMTAEEINFEYGYPALRMADAVRNRTRDMLAHGFEWTMLHGLPANQPNHRYKMAPPCCRMNFTQHGNQPAQYACETPGWFQMSELPYGNPWHGGKWHGTPGKDTGRYVGGEGLEA